MLRQTTPGGTGAPFGPDPATIRVLVVNSDPACARLLRQSLRGSPRGGRAGIDVVAVESLAAALDHLDAPFDAALLDLSLPEHPGLEALGVLWAHAPELPVVVFAEPDEEATALRALQQGAADYLLSDQVGGTVVSRVIRHAVERRRSDERRLRAEDARAASEMRYRSLFQESRDGIYMTAKDGRIVELNPAALELLGYETEELIGRSVLVLYADPADHLHFQREIERSGAVREFEVRLRHSDGSVLWCLVTSSARRSPAGEVLGYQGIIHDITARKRAEEQLAHDAVHDVLTGLPNRSLLMDRLTQAQARRTRNPSLHHAVLYVDLDRFKVVNDTLGHHVGDELLVRVGREIRACLREQDTVARLGGDEFAVLLDEVEGIADATHAADRILARLERPIRLEDHEVVASASIGITLTTRPGETPEDLLRDADTAMYRAKALGRSRYQIFDRRMHREAAMFLRVESELRRGISEGELRLHYQPIFSVRTGVLKGFEALVRWDHPERGLLQPAEFIPVAEDTGLIVPLGMWVLREACSQASEWLPERDELPELCVSVNLSARQFLQPDLVERVGEVLEETGLEGSRLGLELTESALMGNPADAAKMLLRLRELGIRLSLDDFGTGYSSLSHLQRFPMDVLKIDRSFVRMLEDGSGAQLVRTIVDLARSLGMEDVAEGVETEEELSRLAEIGSEAVQGFLLSRPLPPGDAGRFLAGSEV